jgi:hypothetical protein
VRWKPESAGPQRPYARVLTKCTPDWDMSV